MDIVAILIAFVFGLFIGRFYKVILKAIQLAKEDAQSYPQVNKSQQRDSLYFK